MHLDITMIALVEVTLRKAEPVPLDGAFKREVLGFIINQHHDMVLHVLIENENTFESANIIGNFPTANDLSLFLDNLRNNPYIERVTSLHVYGPTSTGKVLVRNTGMEPASPDDSRGMFDFGGG